MNATQLLTPKPDRLSIGGKFPSPINNGSHFLPFEVENPNFNLFKKQIQEEQKHQMEQKKVLAELYTNAKLETEKHLIHEDNERMKEEAEL